MPQRIVGPRDDVFVFAKISFPGIFNDSTTCCFGVWAFFVVSTTMSLAVVVCSSSKESFGKLDRLLSSTSIRVKFVWGSPASAAMANILTQLCTQSTQNWQKLSNQFQLCLENSTFENPQNQGRRREKLSRKLFRIETTILFQKRARNQSRVDKAQN